MTATPARDLGFHAYVLELDKEALSFVDTLKFWLRQHGGISEVERICPLGLDDKQLVIITCSANLSVEISGLPHVKSVVRDAALEFLLV